MEGVIVILIAILIIIILPFTNKRTKDTKAMLLCLYLVQDKLSPRRELEAMLRMKLALGLITLIPNTYPLNENEAQFLQSIMQKIEEKRFASSTPHKNHKETRRDPLLSNEVSPIKKKSGPNCWKQKNITCRKSLDFSKFEGGTIPCN